MEGGGWIGGRRLGETKLALFPKLFTFSFFIYFSRRVTLTRKDWKKVEWIKVWRQRRIKRKRKVERTAVKGVGKDKWKE